MGDKEPELTISCNQVRLLVVGLGPNLQPTICPPYKMCWGKGGTKLVEVANHDWPNLGTIP